MLRSPKAVARASDDSIEEMDSYPPEPVSSRRLSLTNGFRNVWNQARLSKEKAGKALRPDSWAGVLQVSFPLTNPVCDSHGLLTVSQQSCLGIFNILQPPNLFERVLCVDLRTGFLFQLIPAPFSLDW